MTEKEYIEGTKENLTALKEYVYPQSYEMYCEVFEETQKELQLGEAESYYYTQTLLDACKRLHEGQPADRVAQNVYYSSVNLFLKPEDKGDIIGLIGTLCPRGPEFLEVSKLILSELFNGADIAGLITKTRKLHEAYAAELHTESVKDLLGKIEKLDIPKSSSKGFGGAINIKNLGNIDPTVLN